MPGDSVVNVSPPLIPLDQSTYDDLLNPVVECGDYGVCGLCFLH